MAAPDESLPLLALIGRPNVGKSTLFNRLTGLRHALVHDQPGVTRDVREGNGRIGPMRFRVMDTAGLVEAKGDSMEARMTAQSLAAMARADVVALVVDGRAGILPDDRHFAGLARSSGRPVVLLVNKSEGNAGTAGFMDAYRLGLGEPVGISAEHGEGMADLYEALAPFLDRETDEEPEEPHDAEPLPHLNPLDADAPLTGPLKLAIVGRPNAGKSTLLNALLGETRVLAGPEAGLTRDAIAVPFQCEVDGVPQSMTLIDTAGMRRKANVTGPLEHLAVTDAIRTLRFAHVVVVLLDATLGLDKQDAHIAALVEREGRALVIGLNKWDAVKRKADVLEETRHRLETMLPQVRGVQLVTLSAARGQGTEALMRAAVAAYGLWQQRIPTAQLNTWLQGALTRHPPPSVQGRRLKLRYITQVSARPPRFALFATRAEELPEDYRRYLVNGLRDTFHLPGVPLRLFVRKPKNPYAGKV